MRTGWRCSLLFRAEPSGVMIVPARGERVSLPWKQIRRIYISRLLPRRVYLVILTESSRFSMLLHEFVNLRLRPALPATHTRFALLTDGDDLPFSQMVPVLKHLNDERIVSEILSVRPAP